MGAHERMSKRVIGGIANEGRFVRLHEEEKLVAIDEPGAEALVHARLIGKAAVVIHGGVERIVRGGHVVSEDRGGELCFGPIVGLEGVG